MRCTSATIDMLTIASVVCDAIRLVEDTKRGLAVIHIINTAGATATTIQLTDK